jgi:hypothetical protein
MAWMYSVFKKLPSEESDVLTFHYIEVSHLQNCILGYFLALFPDEVAQ